MTASLVLGLYESLPRKGMSRARTVLKYKNFAARKAKFSFFLLKAIVFVGFYITAPETVRARLQGLKKGT